MTELLFPGKLSSRECCSGLLMWLIALVCIAGGGGMWIFGIVAKNQILQVFGNVTVAYLPIMFCVIGACRLLKKREHYEAVV